jgi:hypothetical protein
MTKDRLISRDAATKYQKVGFFLMKKPTENKLLCTKCVTASSFVRWIRANGQRAQCDFVFSHGSRNSAVALEPFCERVDEFFRENYQRGEEIDLYDESDHRYSEQKGDPLNEILSEELGADDSDFVQTIIEHLPDASARDISQGDESFYDDTLNYERIMEVQKREQEHYDDYWYENRFSFQWRDFCKKVQYENRFFKVKEILDKLFGKPSEYQSGKINPLYMLNAGQKIYRARALDESFTDQALSENPAKELGAPPKDRTRAGRMNVEYIPAFYGAFNDQIAVSELRPGIGERIAIGKFVLERDIKVFDFTCFSTKTPDDPMNNYAHTRFEFIMQMESEISLRIPPYEKQRQYIPTQIVSEYLKIYFGCEAVIYRSSVTNDKAKENRNIVVLPRADSFTEGDGALLRHKSFKIMEVENLVYKITEEPKF